MGWLWRSLICGGRSGGSCDVCREEARVGSVVGRGTVRGGGDVVFTRRMVGCRTWWMVEEFEILAF